MVQYVIMRVLTALASGMKVIAVNGRRWKKEVLLAAIREKGPLELLVENDDVFSTHAIDYHGGLRYPHLVRDETKADGLATVIAARAR